LLPARYQLVPAKVISKLPVSTFAIFLSSYFDDPCRAPPPLTPASSIYLLELAPNLRFHRIPSVNWKSLLPQVCRTSPKGIESAPNFPLLASFLEMGGQWHEKRGESI
jgi:hypothetical protein